MSETIETGMVFGVFDGFHPGHQHFLSEAAKQCQTLIVVVARPEIVLVLKNHAPRQSLEKRLEKIVSYNSSWIVIPGDSKIGTWSALKTHTPEVIFLGYDQTALQDELEKLGITYRCITAHHPDTYKSSLLNSDLTT